MEKCNVETMYPRWRVAVVFCLVADVHQREWCVNEQTDTLEKLPQLMEWNTRQVSVTRMLKDDGRENKA